jgi:uncharacterized repeat protein (TIGR03803 family)
VQPTSPEGTEARFLGRNFTPGEVVTFKVVRMRRAPGAADDLKTPSATADVVGSFVAAWKVCDCAGELLQVEAAGKTSGRIARATLFVLPAPPAGAPPAGAAKSSKAAAKAGVEGDAFTPSNAFALQAASATAPPTYQQLKSFGTPSPGGLPQASLLRDADGALYGTTPFGGERGAGTVYRLVPGAPNPDADGDGYPDASDNCPAVSNPDQTDTDGDGQADCVDADDDNDGQTDADEIACGSNPLDANSKATDTDGDHRPDCVDTDGDGDGVPDASDACPGTPPGTAVNAYGCPLAVNKDQCKGDGWKTLRRADNTTFKNQGECNQYSKGK